MGSLGRYLIGLAAAVALAGGIAAIAFSQPLTNMPFERWSVFVEQVRDGYPYLWRARWLVLAAAVGWVLGVGLLLGHIITTGSQHEH